MTQHILQGRTEREVLWFQRRGFLQAAAAWTAAGGFAAAHAQSSSNIVELTGDVLLNGRRLLPRQTILLGSFSKIVAPGFRVGWIVASGEIREKLLVAKQAADLHTSGFVQHILVRYLQDHDIDQHIVKIIAAYGSQCQAMVDGIARHLPTDITWTRPEGGMFLWGRLPGDMSSMGLFEYAVQEKVVFVPGDPFYTTKTDVQTLRLNFSCADAETIEKGIQRLARALERMRNA